MYFHQSFKDYWPRRQILKVRGLSKKEYCFYDFSFIEQFLLILKIIYMSIISINTKYLDVDIIVVFCG